MHIIIVSGYMYIIIFSGYIYIIIIVSGYIYIIIVSGYIYIIIFSGLYHSVYKHYYNFSRYFYQKCDNIVMVATVYNLWRSMNSIYKHLSGEENTIIF